MTITPAAIAAKCDELKALLLEKNAAYGNSAGEPTETFVKGLTPVQRMGVRMDDKISRLQKGSEYPGDDTLLDLAGYLVLMLVLRDVSPNGLPPGDVDPLEVADLSPHIDAVTRIVDELMPRGVYAGPSMEHRPPVSQDVDPGRVALPFRFCGDSTTLHGPHDNYWETGETHSRCKGTSLLPSPL